MTSSSVSAPDRRTGTTAMDNLRYLLHADTGWEECFDLDTFSAKNYRHLPHFGQGSSHLCGLWRLDEGQGDTRWRGRGSDGGVGLGVRWWWRVRQQDEDLHIREHRAGAPDTRQHQ